MLRRIAVFITLIVALSWGAWPMLAQESPPTEPPPNEATISVETSPQEDARIRSRIISILSGLENYDNVKVTVNGGIVTLSGEVLDHQDIDRLDKITSRVAGVVEVENDVVQTTDVNARLAPVIERAKARMIQTLAYLPLLLVATVVGAAIIWIGHRIAKLRQPWARLAPNPFLAGVLRQVIRLFFIIIALVVALDILGATALLGTVLGAAGIFGIALGFAVRDTVENFIASIMLSLRQPFRPNDLVEIDGELGRVQRLTSRATTLLSPDGNDIRIPNATVFTAKITNFTTNPERRFTFDLPINSGADLVAVRAAALDILRAQPFTLTSPAPAVWIENIDDSSVIMRFAGWMTQKGADFNIARGEAMRAVRHGLMAKGYAAPSPVTAIRIENEDTPPAVLPPATSGAIEDLSVEELPPATDHDAEPSWLSETAPRE